MEESKCKKCKDGKHRDGSTCKWCRGTSVYTPPSKDVKKTKEAAQ